jgi:hypothetical protein
VGPRTGLDDVKRKILSLPGLELRPLGRPARSQSLYRLGYPGSYPTGSGIYFSGGKLPRLEFDNSRPSSAEIKNARSHNTAPPYILSTWCLINYERSFTHYLYVF